MRVQMKTKNNAQILTNVLIRHMTVVRMQHVSIQYRRTLAHVNKEKL